MTRLAYGVRAGRDLRVYAPGPDGAALDAARSDLPAGAPVVVGPRRADADAVATALAQLGDLVARGGEVAAGADIDLGGGFRTGRLDGAVGDRRDAVLAALRVLGPDSATRLGDRTGVLVALFGPAATKRVGAAATAALQDGRWAALHLACAASDLLGPEQLERVLGLDGPQETEGLASTLAVDLARLVEPYPRPRRLALVLDLWGVVVAQHAEDDRRRRVRQMRGTDERLSEIKARYDRLVDDETLDRAGGGAGSVRPTELARWIPMPWDWRGWVKRTMEDALAATTLVRAAIAVAEDGVDAGLERVRPLLLAPSLHLSRRGRAAAGRSVAGLARMPARPGVYVGDLAQVLRQGLPASDRVARGVRDRLALARGYAVVVLGSARDLLASATQHAADLSGAWSRDTVWTWRRLVGYTALRSPHEWEQPVLGGPPDVDSADERSTSLAQRLGHNPEADPADVEHPGDLLWYAELADTIAQLDGYDGAIVEFGRWYPDVDTDPPVPEPDPLRPAESSVTRAVTGAVQLADLGAQAPPRPRTWTELVDGLMASAVVAEALTGVFRVPRVVLDHDGTMLPGREEGSHNDVTIEVARDPHQLVSWANYMGNCISGPYYLGEALRGRSVLVALRRPGGHLLANVELRPHRTGWLVGEFRSRFNHFPAPWLDERLRAWVDGLPPAPEQLRRGPAPKPRRGHHTDHRPHRPDRELAELRRSLATLATRALDAPDAPRAVEVLSLNGGGLAGVSALRRVPRQELDEAVRQALAGGLDLRDLWRATAFRPLAEAVGGLDPALRDRTAALELLLGDGPLPALPRRLARSGPIGLARTVEVVGRRLRRSLGRLARADDPTLARLVARRTEPGLICALVLTVSAGAAGIAVTPITRRGQRAVPGHPASTVDDPDGPWRRAWADAAELGAPLPDRSTDLVLRIPTSWLGRGGWPALWARAHR